MVINFTKLQSNYQEICLGKCSSLQSRKIYTVNMWFDDTILYNLLIHLEFFSHCMQISLFLDQMG